MRLIKSLEDLNSRSEGSCFQKTRWFITADWLEDHLIKSGRLLCSTLHRYQFKQNNSQWIENPQNQKLHHQMITTMKMIATNLTPITKILTLLWEWTKCDLVHDELNHILVGPKIKTLYGNGWFTGTITWFNSKLKKLLVVF